MATSWEDFDDSQFEAVVVELARYQFGEGVQEFAKGPDGGRDARFHGVAERFPSTSSPWCGITIFQAKHTNHLNTHFADKSFSSTAKDSVISLEIPRIKKLASKGQLDNYYLVANRRLTGNANEDIVDRLHRECGIAKPSIHLVGTEKLEQAIFRHPDILRIARISPAQFPLNASSYDIAAVIDAFAKVFEDISAPRSVPEVRVSFETKNRLNGMSEELAGALLKKNLRFEKQIATFLADPANNTALEHYEEAAFEFQRKIIGFRDTFESFDDLYNHLLDLLLGRDGFLRSNSKLTHALLFYMYWHCDIGRGPDVSSE